MIPDKIKDLFQFIEYLHSNIEAFNRYNPLINEMYSLSTERDELNPLINYKDKQRFNEVQAEMESKNKELQSSTADLIMAKAIELGIGNFSNDIQQLKDGFTDQDLPKILESRTKYIEYRTSTHGTFLSLGFFFHDLDRSIKPLFNYFTTEAEQNEYEPFRERKISIDEAQNAFDLLNKKQPIHQLAVIEQKQDIEQPKTFEELFVKPKIIDKCINLLRETEQPCIDEGKQFIRNKGAFVVWFKVLEYKRVFKYSFKNDTERACVLNSNFEGLNISDSLFRQPNKRATESHKAHFETEITAIKH